MHDPNFIFNKIVKDELWPSFKKLGYKRAGNNFRYYHSDGWGRIIQFQKSRYNLANELSFTVNISLYLADFEYHLCSTKSEYRFQESVCAVRKRLGPLTGRNSDSWIILNAYSDINKVTKQLDSDFTQYIHPYLASTKSQKDILAILIAGHQSDYPLAQIQTMFYTDYKGAALELIKSELIRSKHNQHYCSNLQLVIKELRLTDEQLCE